MFMEDMPNKRVLSFEGTDLVSLKEWVEPMINGVELLIEEIMVEFTTLVIWLETLGGNISPMMIVHVGVVGIPDIDTYKVPSIIAHLRGRLSVNSNP
jgi:hypothetical protein